MTQITYRYQLNDELQIDQVPCLFTTKSQSNIEDTNLLLKEVFNPILASHKERYKFVRGNLVNTLYL